MSTLKGIQKKTKLRKLTEKKIDVKRVTISSRFYRKTTFSTPKVIYSILRSKKIASAISEILLIVFALRKQNV